MMFSFLCLFFSFFLNNSSSFFLSRVHTSITDLLINTACFCSFALYLPCLPVQLRIAANKQRLCLKYYYSTPLHWRLSIRFTISISTQLLLLLSNHSRMNGQYSYWPYSLNKYIRICDDIPPWRRLCDTSAGVDRGREEQGYFVSPLPVFLLSLYCRREDLHEPVWGCKMKWGHR